MKSMPLALIALLGFSITTMASAAQAPTTTRKVVLEKQDKGYRWKLVEAPVPVPGEHQVLIHVRAIALNRGDLEMLAQDEGRDSSGLVVGSDAAGDIVAVGKQVKGFATGDKITSLYFKNWTDGPPSREKMTAALGASVDGVFGDYIVLDDTSVAPMPKGLSYEEAATLPTAGLTGWMASAGQRPLGKNDVVLVQGTGGVSVFALQFAHRSGARVIVTSSSDDKLRRAQEIGARDGINYRSVPAWSEQVLKLTGQHGADIVVDVGGKDTLEQSVKSLAYLGTLSIVGGLTGYGGNIPSLGLLMKTARAQGVFVGSRVDYTRMGEFITRHKLHPVIDKVFTFEEREAALKHLGSGNFVGKIVITL